MYPTLKCSLVLFSLMGIVSAKRISPCELVSELIQMTVFTSEKEEFVDCNLRDVARLVCVASLHNFNTTFVYKELENYKIYMGLFGSPENLTHGNEDITKYTDGLANKTVSDTHLNFAMLQLKTRRYKQRIISEVICESFGMYFEDFNSLLVKWGLPMNTSYEKYFKKSTITCDHIDLSRALSHPSLEPTENIKSLSNNAMEIYVVNENTLKIYRPGFLDPWPERDLYDKCMPWAYCTTFGLPSHCYCSPQSTPGAKRKDAGRVERKITNFIKIFDWAVIVIWLLCVGSGIVAGCVYLRNPRRRVVQRDDWSRPILTAHFNQME